MSDLPASNSDSASASASASGSPSASTPPPTTPEKKSEPRRPRRWRRRFMVVLLTIIAIGVLLRVILVIALPGVMRKVAARYDLNCEYEHTELYLISGNVGVWHLVLTPKSGGAPLLAADYLRGDVSAINLLRGKL